MGVCIKLATRSLRKNKGRTLITLMGIVLSVLMVCTIFTLLNSMLDSAIDSIIEKDGNWHIAVYNTTAEQIADLEAALTKRMYSALHLKIQTRCTNLQADI